MPQALTKHQRQVKYIEDFAAELVKAGFRVWLPKDHTWRTYLYAANKLGNLGYCQVDDLTGCIKYTTVHKPHQSIGCGFQYSEGLGTVDGMDNCCNTHTPHWAINYSGHVTKWKLDRWINQATHLEELVNA